MTSLCRDHDDILAHLGPDLNAMIRPILLSCIPRKSIRFLSCLAMGMTFGPEDPLFCLLDIMRELQRPNFIRYTDMYPVAGDFLSWASSRIDSASALASQ